MFGSKEPMAWGTAPVINNPWNILSQGYFCPEKWNKSQGDNLFSPLIKKKYDYKHKTIINKIVMLKTKITS